MNNWKKGDDYHGKKASTFGIHKMNEEFEIEHFNAVEVNTSEEDRDRILEFLQRKEEK